MSVYITGGVMENFNLYNIVWINLFDLPLFYLFVMFLYNLHVIGNVFVSIGTEFGVESVTILTTWEKLEKKIADFKNHRRFTLRCISQKITPPAWNWKVILKPPEGRGSYRGQRNNWQMNVRSINNTTEICTCRRDACMEQIQGQISANYYKECCDFMERVREHRHRFTLGRHLKTNE